MLNTYFAETIFEVSRNPNVHMSMYIAGTWLTYLLISFYFLRSFQKYREGITLLRDWRTTKGKTIYA
jgi:hypothetical protein